MTGEALAVGLTAEKAAAIDAVPDGAKTTAPGEQVAIVFHRPPGFREMTDDEERGAWLGDLPDEADESLRQAAVQLRQIGVAHVSVYVLKVGASVTSAALTVAVIPCPAGAESTAVAEQLVESLVGTEARVLRMPIGPVVGAVCGRSVNLTNEELTRTSDDGPLDTSEWEFGEFRAYVPLPQHGCMVLLTLSTPMVPGWDAYAPMMAGVLRTLRIEKS